MFKRERVQEQTVCGVCVAFRACTELMAYPSCVWEKGHRSSGSWDMEGVTLKFRWKGFTPQPILKLILMVETWFFICWIPNEPGYNVDWVLFQFLIPGCGNLCLKFDLLLRRNDRKYGSKIEKVRSLRRALRYCALNSSLQLCDCRLLLSDD